MKKYNDDIIFKICSEINKSSKELSGELNIPYNTIKAIRTKNKIKVNKPKTKLDSLEDNFTDNQLLDLYFNFKNISYIAFLCGVDSQILSNKYKQLGISKEIRKPLTNTEIEFIKENIEVLTNAQICEKLNCSKSLLSKIMLKYDIHRKQEYLSYFESIDTQDKAYWLGLLSADGTVHIRPNGQGFISLTLKREDEYHLTNLYDSMGKIFRRYIYQGEVLNKSGTISQYSNIQIGGRKLTDSLIKLGVLAGERTWSYEPPKILSDRLFFAFLRGYFDGDGTITKNNNKDLPSSYSVSLCGNKFTMEYFKVFLEKYNIKTFVRQDTHLEYAKPFYTLGFNTSSDIYLFLKFIYKDINEKTYLKRKYSKAKMFIELYESNCQQRVKYTEHINYFKNCPLYK